MTVKMQATAVDLGLDLAAAGEGLVEEDLGRRLWREPFLELLCFPPAACLCSTVRLHCRTAWRSDFFKLGVCSLASSSLQSTIGLYCFYKETKMSCILTQQSVLEVSLR